MARCEAEPEATIATLPGPLLDRLVGLGAVVATPPPGPLQVAVVPLATADEGAAAALATALDTLALERVTVVGPDEASTLVWVRAATPLGAGLEAAHPPGLPVLLVDLAYHDVVSVGPWWVPPATACPWCYLGRLRHRWGDHPVPAQAAVTRWPVVAAGLVGVQLEAIAARRSTLTNAAISWDLRHGGSDRQVVLKVPWCPMCEEAA